MAIIEKKLNFENIDLVSLFGFNNSHLLLIENRFSSGIIHRGNNLILKGNEDEIIKIEKILNEMKYMLNRNKQLTEADVKTVIDIVDSNKIAEPKKETGSLSNVIFNGVKDAIRTRTQKQLEYWQKVQQNDMVFAVGPAGTGKTFLAVAMALASLRNNEVGRIILSRPAVEAGESLGFLPGDLQEKIDPYIKPLTDALQFMLGAEKVKILMDKNTIEITPLAYMRGRTLNNAFIILDEAQNATSVQMKMFLTRMGAKSKAIITGDVTQIDLPHNTLSGLIHATKLLKNIDGIDFVYFDNRDVVRHKLVADIIRAYERESEELNNGNSL